MIVGFLVLWAMLLWLPDIPMRRGLRRWMVEVPAERLGRVTRGQWLMLGLVLASVVLCVWLIGREAPMLIGMGLPDMALVASSMEMTSLLDAAVTALVLAAGVRWKSVAQAMRARLRIGRPGTARRRRARRVHRPGRTGANDDDPAPALLPLAA